MPIKNGTLYCVNHPTQQLARNEGLNAITQLIKKGDKISFNPTTGIPVAVFFCPQCGYIETYAAKLVGELD